MIKSFWYPHLTTIIVLHLNLQHHVWLCSRESRTVIPPRQTWTYRSYSNSIIQSWETDYSEHRLCYINRSIWGKGQDCRKHITFLAVLCMFTRCIHGTSFHGLLSPRHMKHKVLTYLFEFYFVSSYRYPRITCRIRSLHFTLVSKRVQKGPNGLKRGFLLKNMGALEEVVWNSLEKRGALWY